MAPELTILFVVVGSAVVSMGVFGVSRAGAARSSELPRDRRRFVLGPFFPEWFHWALGPALRASLAFGATPLFFNLLGIGLAILAGSCVALGWIGLGGWLILIGGICDSLDGRVARARRMAAPYGAFLDSVLDRFAEVAVFVGIAVVLSFEPVAAPLSIAALGGSLTVSYARARGESLGVVCARGIMQRAERLLLLGLSAILDSSISGWIGRESPGGLLLPALALIAVGTLGTAVYRTLWIVRRLRAEPPGAAEKGGGVGDSA